MGWGRQESGALGPGARGHRSARALRPRLGRGQKTAAADRWGGGDALTGPNDSRRADARSSGAGGEVAAHRTGASRVQLARADRQTMHRREHGRCRLGHVQHNERQRKHQRRPPRPAAPDAALRLR
jgi:hypothetical protein